MTSNPVHLPADKVWSQMESVGQLIRFELKAYQFRMRPREPNEGAAGGIVHSHSRGPYPCTENPNQWGETIAEGWL
jgi:hypothetical protein